jgi:hypothetical protein
MEAIYERPRDYDLEHEGDDEDVSFYLRTLDLWWPRRVMELASGSGRVTIPLARAAASLGSELVGSSGKGRCSLRRVASEPVLANGRAAAYRSSRATCEVGGRRSRSTSSSRRAPLSPTCSRLRTRSRRGDVRSTIWLPADGS